MCKQEKAPIKLVLGDDARMHEVVRIVNWTLARKVFGRRFSE